MQLMGKAPVLKFHTCMLSDANLNRYAIETQQRYWKIESRKLKFRFDRKPRPNIYNKNVNQRYKPTQCL
jgi:hypothetical protein